jgi:Ca2+-binding RTX toxin-like protein
MNQKAPHNGRIQKYGLRTLLLGAVVGAQTVLVTAPAQAITDVFPGGSGLNILATQGKTNNIVISREGDSFVIRDSGDTISGFAGCATVGDSARCPTAGISSIIVDGQNRNDTITMDPGLGTRGQLFGGAGRDRLSAGSGNDTLNGGGDRDRLSGGNGNDTLNGGPGRDILDGGPGFDTCNGGPGVDTIINCEVTQS